MQEISADRAYWIFNFYQRNGIHLLLQGRILGEEVAAEVQIAQLDRTLHQIAIDIFLEDGHKACQQVVHLHDAAFSFQLFSKIGFGELAVDGCHSILGLGFPDGTELLLAQFVSLLGSAHGNAGCN